MQSFFNPIDLSPMHLPQADAFRSILNITSVYTTDDNFPDISEADIVLIGVPEDRAAVRNKGCAAAPDAIRSRFYPLAVPVDNLRLADLGNLIIGTTPADTYAAISTIASELVNRGKLLIVLGGSQDLTFALYSAYAALGRVVNIAAIDSRFDIAESEQINSRSYLNHIIVQKPNYLFNFTNVGYQTYFVGKEYIDLMEQMRFQARRLGEIQGDMLLAEPLLRNADIVTVDMAAIRQSDSPACADPSPHGFYGEQLCQLARFAGMSDRNSVLLISELNPLYDRENQSAHLVAHALWHYIEGYDNRTHDFPYRDKYNYLTYTVQLKDSDAELVFYKSKKSGRWWVKVPCLDEERAARYGELLLIPCNATDYDTAMQNEIPEIYWHYYRWLNEEE